ncbi:hypothetical protein B7463_g9502, partial [Scytalidium lignicola]
MRFQWLITIFHSALLFALTAGAGCDTGHAIVAYPFPESMRRNTAYSVEVQQLAGPVKTVDSYLATVAQVNTTSGSAEIYNTSVASFDFCGSVKILVKYNAGKIHNAVVRPYSYGIKPKISGNTLTFTLNTPQNIVVQVNEDIFGTLQLLTNPIESNVPDPNDPDILYFGRGINNGTAYANVSSGVLNVTSGKTVYVEGGGVLTAQVSFTNISEASLRGRGVLYNNLGGGVLIQNASNITIEDIIILNPGGYAVLTGSSNGVTISGIRAFSSRSNGDGIDIFCSQNVLIDGVFMRNSDDNIALYQHRWTYYGNSSNLTLQNSALWADYAHPVNIGTHGNTDDPETMDGVTIRNIDILDQHEPQMWYQGCITINAGDSNTIQNVYVEDVRIENIRLGQLVNFRTMNNSMYNTSPGNIIQNVYIKDMAYQGDHANPSLVLGFDTSHPIVNITFDNLTVNGKQIYDTMKKPTWYYTSDFVPLFANEHVSGLTFVNTGN